MKNHYIEALVNIDLLIFLSGMAFKKLHIVPCLLKHESSSNQVKKLVYVYLVRYAEEQQDLALLSISTFQRALKVRFGLSPADISSQLLNTLGTSFSQTFNHKFSLSENYQK